MAKAEVVKVTLSNTDRQLLRDIRDALRALGGESEDEGSAPAGARRLVEAAKRGAAPTFLCGNDKWHPGFLDDHYDADAKGYTWNGSGSVPKG